MKKTITLMAAAVLLGSLCGQASAADFNYVSTSATKYWAAAGSWSIDGEVTTTSVAPFMGDYAAQGGTVTVDGYTLQTVTGSVNMWDSTLNIIGGSTVVFANVTKVQHVNLVVDENSSLKISKSGGTFTYNSDATGYSWDIAGSLTLGNISWSHTSAIDVTLGTTGSIAMWSGDVTALSVSATLGTLTTEGAYAIKERVLISNTNGGALNGFSASNFTVTDGTLVEDISTLALTSDNLGKYQIVNREDGIVLRYIDGGAIPEPTTATLSLLALAGLAVYRRERCEGKISMK